MTADAKTGHVGGEIEACIDALYSFNAVDSCETAFGSSEKILAACEWPIPLVCVGHMPLDLASLMTLLDLGGVPT